MMFVLFASVLVSSTAKPPPSEKPFYCQGFSEATSCTASAWVGALQDLFSPDDTCPKSTRYVEFGNTSNYDFDGLLHVSASNTDDGCNSTWGRKFHPMGSVDPVVSISGCVGKVSFASKVPSGAPVYKYVEAGALNFTLRWGVFQGISGYIMWNGLYDGEGGPWLSSDNAEIQVLPSDCDNFWAPVFTVGTFI
mmetsp:Transcript_50996/g.136020  ORF Transcript_50996/g.136020 Transcript_50996/m.136020 type:complete len:193 (-) Transcript_50996:85-663(-)